MIEKNKKPSIRFKGFTDEWEERKFAEVYSYLQNNTLSRAELNYESGIAKNVHYGDVLIKFGECLDVKTSKLPMILNESVLAKLKASFLKEGDVVIADTAEDETVGKCCEMVELKDEIVLSGLHTIPCRPNWKFATGYLGYYMNSPSYHDQLLPLMQGTKVTSVSKTALKNTDVAYPKKIEEQTKITAFFKQLNNLITLHQRKHYKLINIKEAMLQKMFPKNGSNVPEIRFKGFTDEWEQRKLGEITKLGSSKRVHREDYTETGIPFFRGLEISKLGTSSNLGDVLYISEKYYKDLKCKYGVPEVGDILITAVGTLGNTYLIRDNTPFYFKDGNLILLSNIQINSHYLNIYLGEGMGKKRVLESAAGSNQKALTMVKLENVEVLFPNLEEQEKIGAFFEQLDNLITLHQRELEKLKNMKKACFQRMFL